MAPPPAFVPPLVTSGPLARATPLRPSPRTSSFTPGHGPLTAGAEASAAATSVTRPRMAAADPADAIRSAGGVDPLTHHVAATLLRANPPAPTGGRWDTATQTVESPSLPSSAGSAPQWASLRSVVCGTSAGGGWVGGGDAIAADAAAKRSAWEAEMAALRSGKRLRRRVAAKVSAAAPTTVSRPVSVSVGGARVMGSTPYAQRMARLGEHASAVALTMAMAAAAKQAEEEAAAIKAAEEATAAKKAAEEAAVAKALAEVAAAKLAAEEAAAAKKAAEEEAAAKQAAEEAAVAKAKAEEVAAKLAAEEAAAAQEAAEVAAAAKAEAAAAKKVKAEAAAAKKASTVVKTRRTTSVRSVKAKTSGDAINAPVVAKKATPASKSPPKVAAATKTTKVTKAAAVKKAAGAAASDAPKVTIPMVAKTVKAAKATQPRGAKRAGASASPAPSKLNVSTPAAVASAGAGKAVKRTAVKKAGTGASKAKVSTQVVAMSKMAAKTAVKPRPVAAAPAVAPAEPSKVKSKPTRAVSKPKTTRAASKPKPAQATSKVSAPVVAAPQTPDLTPPTRTAGGASAPGPPASTPPAPVLSERAGANASPVEDKSETVAATPEPEAGAAGPAMAARDLPETAVLQFSAPPSGGMPALEHMSAAGGVSAVALAHPGYSTASAAVVPPSKEDDGMVLGETVHQWVPPVLTAAFVGACLALTHVSAVIGATGTASGTPLM